MKIYLVLDAAEAELWPNADGVPLKKLNNLSFASKKGVFKKENSLLVIQVVVVCVVVVEGGDSAGEAGQVLQAALGGATYIQRRVSHI